MENIIEKLYMGKISPFEENGDIINRYKGKDAWHKRSENEFYESLNEHQKREYEKLMEEHFELLDDELGDAFCQGFQLAVQFIVQALA